MLVVCRKVNQAKTQIRQQMVEKGEAVAYSEPESEVVSRSGDSCIVALMDQWYLDYGEPAWRELAKKFVEKRARSGPAFVRVLTVGARGGGIVQVPGRHGDPGLGDAQPL